MIIAVDESGNFDTKNNKFNMFVAAHIQNKNGSLEIKRKQFESWEKKVPANMKDKKGEIKGQLLGKIELKNFIKNVVFQKPEIRFTYVSINPQKNKIELINKHKDFESQQIQLSFENFKKAKSKKSNINFLDQLYKWINKRNEIEYLKLHCLKNCLYDSLHNTFIYCTVFNMIDELLDIQFKVDKDFISNEDRYWKMYSIRSIQELTKKRPIKMLKDWDDNHPVRKKYVIKNQGFDLNSAMKDNLNFLDSKDNFEIRIADIAAIIFYRHWNKTGVKSHFENLKKKHAARDEHHNLILNDFDFDQELEIVKSEMK